jgi:hypothetical protein
MQDVFVFTHICNMSIFCSTYKLKKTIKNQKNKENMAKIKEKNHEMLDVSLNILHIYIHMLYGHIYIQHAKCVYLTVSKLFRE